jgi:hypothetical protein
MKIDAVGPPRSDGGRTFDCGNGSESISFESPICNSACATEPSGPGIRIVSSAPKASL